MRKASLLVIGLLTLLIGCSDTAPDGEFCEQAQFFASRSIRDADSDEDRSDTGYLVALTRLRDLAPANLRSDLDLLVAYERDLNAEGKTEDVAVASAGVRVGRFIELHCRVQLPGVQGERRARIWQWRGRSTATPDGVRRRSRQARDQARSGSSAATRRASVAYPPASSMAVPSIDRSPPRPAGTTIIAAPKSTISTVPPDAMPQRRRELGVHNVEGESSTKLKMNLPQMLR